VVEIKQSSHDQNNTYQICFIKWFNDKKLYAFLVGFFLHFPMLIAMIFLQFPVDIIYREFFFCIFTGFVVLCVVWLPNALNTYNNEFQKILSPKNTKGRKTQIPFVNNNILVSIFVIFIPGGALLNFWGLIYIRDKPLCFKVLYIIIGSIEWPFLACFIFFCLRSFILLITDLYQILKEKYKLQFTYNHPDNFGGLRFISKFLFKVIVASLLNFYLIAIQFFQNYVFAPHLSLREILFYTTMWGFFCIILMIAVGLIATLILFGKIIEKYKKQCYTSIQAKMKTNLQNVNKGQMTPELELLKRLYYEIILGRINAMKKWPYFTALMIEVLTLGVGPLISYFIGYLIIYFLILM